MTFTLGIAHMKSLNSELFRSLFLVLLRCFGLSSFLGECCRRLGLVVRFQVESYICGPARGGRWLRLQVWCLLVQLAWFTVCTCGSAVLHSLIPAALKSI